ncbi:helix-turn-helix domain-containing protein [Mammaliicoccus vitulinus]|uniref:helix-turn-helix domain-containing protein n=1 Tax=Mammaliicoccus vitulinus TaxID=71237 RepID=UPI0015FB25EF|nr:helix-turn-helix domain-containing protein [Mammaliicoccus vitulinus]
MNTKKTTLEERIEIVKYCLDHNITCKEASEKFNLKYSQLYSWIQKYKEHGEDGLIDGRGKGKPQSIMTPEEELNARIKVLEERNKYLEMENEVLKKRGRDREAVDERKIRQKASYKTIKSLKDTYPIVWLCQELEISRASYYKWMNRKTPNDK